MKFEIRSAKNGCILKVLEPSETGGNDELVYQSKAQDEFENFAEFLYEILENFGPSSSRYSEKRIYIEVRPGDKFEGGKE